MVMREPVLMELPVAPIVSPSKQTGDICGILGYDFFRRATVALPQVQVRGGRGVGLGFGTAVSLVC